MEQTNPGDRVAAVLLTGRTYPLRRELAAAGGRWHREHDGYLWPIAQRETAERLAEAHGLDAETLDVAPAELAPPTVAERREARAAKHERRAERLAGWAESHDAKAAEHRARADGPGGMMRDWAAITQPITDNAGGRAWARTKERMRDSLRRERDELVRADEQRAAATAAATAAERIDRQERDPAFIERRITELEAEQRRTQRAIDGKAHHGLDVAPASGAYLERLQAQQAETAEALAFWRERLAAVGGMSFGPHNVAVGDTVRIRGAWHRVDRANRKTVRATQVSGVCVGWADNWPWGEVREHRPAAGTAAAD